jgi:hypothetical protein
MMTDDNDADSNLLLQHQRLDEIKASLYQALLWMDPLQETLTPRHLTQAYDLLWNTITSLHRLPPQQESDGDYSHQNHLILASLSLHPRQQQAFGIIIKSFPYTNNDLDLSCHEDWKDVHCDLIRAMVVTCYLLLEIAPRQGHHCEEEEEDLEDHAENDATVAITTDTLALAPHHVKALHQTIERCYCLLQVLKSSSSTSHHPSHSTSHYPLLQGAMEGPDPWIPKSKHERQCWSIELETSRIIEQQQQQQRKRQKQEHDEDHATDDQIIGKDDDDDSMIMLDLDPSSLRQDETTLLKMANTPIPYMKRQDYCLLGTSLSSSAMLPSSHNNSNNGNDCQLVDDNNELDPTFNNRIEYYYYLWPKCGLIQAVPTSSLSSTMTVACTTSFRPGKVTTAETELSMASSTPITTSSSSSSHATANATTHHARLWALTSQTTYKEHPPTAVQNGNGDDGNAAKHNPPSTIHDSHQGMLCIQNLLPLLLSPNNNNASIGNDDDTIPPLVSLDVMVLPTIITANGVRKLQSILLKELPKQRQAQKALLKEWTHDEFRTTRQQVEMWWNQITQR